MESNGKREKDGRFTQGNSGGPGRPTRQTEYGYLRALSEECPLDTWRKIVRSAIKRAKDGDCKALEWLSQYLIGRPLKNATRISGLDAAENEDKKFKILF